MKRAFHSVLLLAVLSAALTTASVAQTPAPNVPGLECPPKIGAVSLDFDHSESVGQVVPWESASSFYLACVYKFDGGITDGGAINIIWDTAPTLPCPASDDPTAIVSATNWAFASVAPSLSEGAPTKEQLAAEAQRLLALVEPLASPCGPAPTPTPTGNVCEVTGMVTDHLGKPVAGIHVQLNGPGLQVDTATDASGNYRFSNFVTGLSFDPQTDKAMVSLYLEQQNRFQFIYKTEPVEQRTTPIDVKIPSECKRNFTTPGTYQTMVPNDVAHFKDLWAMYRQLELAWRFAEQELFVQMDYLPLRILTWCDTAINLSCDTTRHAFYNGSSTNGSSVHPPELVFEVAESSGKSSAVDDTMYHEFGHHIMADVFENAVPTQPERKPHGGYYVNSSTNDAWLEGFASFYAAMVAKVFEGRTADPSFRYTGGSTERLEPNMPMWGGNGKREEFAVAGLLLDFEDGQLDYASANPPVSAITNVKYRVLKPKSGHTIVVGKIPNFRKGSLALLFIEFVNAAGKKVATRSIFIDGSTQRDDDGALFWTVAPKSLEYSSIKIGGLQENELDDDPIDLELADLWLALETGKIAAPKPGKPDGYAHIFDVHELYQVLKLEFGGEDRDGDSVEDVDQIFLMHGVHSDPNSNKTFDAGETIGLTNRRLLDAAGQPTGTAAERTLPEPLEEQMVTVDTGDIDASFIAFVNFPAPNEGDGYSYVVSSDEEGRVAAIVPPEDSGGSVTLMALADGHLPEVVAEIDAKKFWTEALEHPDESFLNYNVDLEEGEITLEGERSSSAALILIAAGGLASLAAGVQLLARRRSIPDL